MTGRVHVPGPSRRAFLAGLAGLAGVANAPFARSASADAPVLEARAGSAQLAPPEYPETPIWGYAGRVPGPTIRVRQGERVARRFVNRLPRPSTVHWHGIRIDNAMDGVPDLTQEAVPPGGSFLYDFAVPDAGAYWYHAHDRAWEQVARGLYGALIVEEEAPPRVDRDATLLIDDWRLTAEAAIAEDFGNLHDRAHAGRIGNHVTVNGAAAWKRAAGRRERFRLRLANVANARVFSLALSGLDGWTVALDGQPLAAPEPAERLKLAPAQRADLIVDVTAEEGGEAFVVSEERGRGNALRSYALATFAVSGTKRARRLSVPDALPANPVSSPTDVDAARRTVLRMEGGAMGGLRAATLEGRSMDMRELAARGRVWALNGVADDLPDAPLLRAAAGETVRIALVNDTAWPHAMHLHGHHFGTVGADGGIGPLRDTTLVERGETADIAFVADNPGDWLLHCHMLGHAAAGMRTWIRVG